jgi:hypothetical protein
MRLAPVFRPVGFHAAQSISAGLKPAFKTSTKSSQIFQKAGSKDLCEAIRIPRLKTRAMLLISPHFHKNTSVGSSFYETTPQKSKNLPFLINLTFC